MGMRYAVIEEGMVVNIILWDGKTEFPVPDWQSLINISDLSEQPAIGWAYSDGEFTAPPAPEPSYEDLVSYAELKKRVLIEEVHTKTEMLRATLMLGRIKDDEKALLNDWVDYLDELEEMDVSTAPDIEWPEKP